jgi:Mg2+ and Co2+ transporter CorA
MLLVGLFDIDAISRPIIGKNPYDFWLIFGGVIIIISFMTYYFKRRGWL